MPKVHDSEADSDFEFDEVASSAESGSLTYSEEESSNSNDEEDIDDFKFQILNPAQINEYMAKKIHEANNVIQLPENQVRALLNHFQWDQQKLLENFYSHSDQKDLFKEANIASLSPPKKRKIAESQDCEICFITPSEGKIHRRSRAFLR